MRTLDENWLRGKGQSWSLFGCDLPCLQQNDCYNAAVSKSLQWVQQSMTPLFPEFLFGTISLKRTMLRYYLATPNPSFIPSILCSIPLLSISYGMKSETHRVKRNALENFCHLINYQVFTTCAYCVPKQANPCRCIIEYGFPMIPPAFSCFITTFFRITSISM